MTNPTETLLQSLAARGLAYTIQYEHRGAEEHPVVLTVRTAPLEAPKTAAPHPVYLVIRDMLAHAIEGQGTCGGALEHYPLSDGRVFSVTWIGGENDTPQSAILNIASMGKAW